MGWPSRSTFPPYAEVAADIVAGRIDAVEMQALTPRGGRPVDPELVPLSGLWLPPSRRRRDRQDVGGDPARCHPTYARSTTTGRPRSPDSPRAVKAGRTYVSSGAFVELRVDGCEPGDVIRMGPDGGAVEVRAEASAAQPGDRRP
jgi:hypothetical protein